jgi:hypothetical protein
MVTLDIYFEYMKILCKIFIKYIVPILQVYPSYLIIFIKLLEMPFIVINIIIL